jgi:predicted dehydrogenase
VLAQLATWGVIHLTVVDRAPDAPSELADFLRDGVLDYLSWDHVESASGPWPWQIAFVVTSPEAHLEVIRSLVLRVPTLRMVVCEKPCGANLAQMHAALEVCRRAHVRLWVSDHYLLRPSVQYLLQHPHLLDDLGPLVHITATMNETSPLGPPQGTIGDMAVHLINVLHTLWRGAEFVPETAFVAQARQQPHTAAETYCFCLGHLHIPAFLPVPCELECGKQLEEDKKQVSIIGTHGRVELNLVANTLTITNPHAEEVQLQWKKPEWSYARLILQTLSALSTVPPAPSPESSC